MCRAVDVLDAVPRGDGRLDREILQRRGRLAVAPEWIEILNQSALALGDGCEAERHLLIGLRRHGKNAHAEEIAANILQQAGVLGSPDDRGVNLAGLFRLDKLT